LRVRLNSFDAICRMVEVGIGIAIIPETAARRARGLRIVRLAEPWSERTLSVCLRRRAELATPARLLVEHLEEAGVR
jgi:DNA-binding transcriptional LysR family regulator